MSPSQQMVRKSDGWVGGLRIEVALAHSSYLYGGWSGPQAKMSLMHQVGPLEMVPVGMEVVMEDMVVRWRPWGGEVRDR